MRSEQLSSFITEDTTNNQSSSTDLPFVFAFHVRDAIKTKPHKNQAITSKTKNIKQPFRFWYLNEEGNNFKRFGLNIYLKTFITDSIFD